MPGDSVPWGAWSHGSTTWRYPAELRERSLRMVTEIRADQESQWAAMSKVVELLRGGMPETVRNWCLRAKIDAGKAARSHG